MSFIIKFESKIILILLKNYNKIKNIYILSEEKNIELLEKLWQIKINKEKKINKDKKINKKINKLNNFDINFIINLFIFDNNIINNIKKIYSLILLVLSLGFLLYFIKYINNNSIYEYFYYKNIYINNNIYNNKNTYIYYYYTTQYYYIFDIINSVIPYYEPKIEPNKYDPLFNYIESLPLRKRVIFIFFFTTGLILTSYFYEKTMDYIWDHIYDYFTH